MKRQSIWVSAIFSVCLVSIMCSFIMIALQINAINTLEKQNKLLTEVAGTQTQIAEDHTNIIKGSITLSDEDDIDEPDTKTSNDSTITVEELETFVKDDDIVVEEKIVIHSDKGTGEKIVGQDMDLPDLPTDRKVVTHYGVYNIPGTPHNRMQQLAWTDDLGCRRYGNYYIVGLGSAYADRIGETFEIELDTGFVFQIITGDMKADVHTDPTNRYAPIVNYDGLDSANILEFIVDKNVLAKAAYQWGGVDYYEQFKGNIVRMTYLGRDESADWDSYF